ncbi:sterile alpha motif domain-containing protein 14 isoform X2 [Gouania willdenowi]|uniref:sterile alpha motif domain-containing protein 14 isoform X2 n=1 Tax=Gouania willdenowi TaxID=441366 RepID=UPI0010541456|nr:sterile alpha motif domain-containing protein 14 isoform X2 [Gouania willdenowi]
MMSADLFDMDNVFDLNEAVPETELLDNSIQKGRAQLSVKSRRPRPSKSRYRDSMSSTEGEDRPESKVINKEQMQQRGSSPSPELLLPARSPAFSFDTSLGRRSPENGNKSLATPPRGRYHQLTNATSQEALIAVSSSKSGQSEEGAIVHLRTDSQVLVSETSPDSGPDDPTAVFDKKTKRRFLDLGVTLRRSYIRVRKDKSNRFSTGSRDTSESPSRSSGSFVSFSWFSEGRGSPEIPPTSPRLTLKSVRSDSQDSVISEECPPPPGNSSTSRSSHPYHTLSQSSDEPCEEMSSLVCSWSNQQVCQWLKGLRMEKYVQDFTDVDGPKLLTLDGTKLKALGVHNSADRSVLKRRIKDIQSAAEKERKAQSKLEKMRRRRT